MIKVQIRMIRITKKVILTMNVTVSVKFCMMKMTL